MVFTDLRYSNITPSHGTGGWLLETSGGRDMVTLLCLLVLRSFPAFQNALFCPLHRDTFVLHLLEHRTASMKETIAAAAIVWRTSRSRVSLTRPLGLDSGGQHFVLQQAVAPKVGARDRIVVSLFTNWKMAVLSRVTERNVQHCKSLLCSRFDE